MLSAPLTEQLLTHLRSFFGEITPLYLLLSIQLIEVHSGHTSPAVDDVQSTKRQQSLKTNWEIADGIFSRSWLAEFDVGISINMQTM